MIVRACPVCGQVVMVAMARSVAKHPDGAGHSCPMSNRLAPSKSESTPHIDSGLECIRCGRRAFPTNPVNLRTGICVWCQRNPDPSNRRTTA